VLLFSQGIGVELDIILLRSFKISKKDFSSTAAQKKIYKKTQENAAVIWVIV